LIQYTVANRVGSLWIVEKNLNEEAMLVRLLRKRLDDFQKAHVFLRKSSDDFVKSTGVFAQNLRRFFKKLRAFV